MYGKILVVDDEELNRELLRQMFEDEYEILMAVDGYEAIDRIETFGEDIRVVLLDLLMPRMSGFKVLEYLNNKGITDKIPVVLITANTDLKMALSCYSLGAADIINKPFVAQIVRQRIINVTEMYSNRETLKGLLANSNEKLSERERQLKEFNENLIEAISNIVEFRNMESGLHVKRVKGMTRIMASTYKDMFPETGLTDDDVDIISHASALHDIGKIVIPDNILLKPGKLTGDEWEIMKTHTVRGSDILKRLGKVQDEEHTKVANQIVRYHHERYDGKGYPEGLSGDDIPLPAQLAAVADVYDALVSERVYKPAYTKEEAFKMICNGECGQFSPKIVSCLTHAKGEIEKLSDAYAESE